MSEQHVIADLRANHKQLKIQYDKLEAENEQLAKKNAVLDSSWKVQSTIICQLHNALRKADPIVAKQYESGIDETINYLKGVEEENKRLKKEVGDLRAAAVRKGLMKGGCFTGKGG